MKFDIYGYMLEAKIMCCKYGKSRRLRKGRDWKVILYLKACCTVQKCNGRVHK